MERHHVSDADVLPGYDALQFNRSFIKVEPLSEPPSSLEGSNSFFENYHKIHKVFVGESGSRLLRSIHQGLKDEHEPSYLDVAGWAIAEAALVEESVSATKRIEWIKSAEDCWERAIGLQEEIDQSLPESDVEDDAKFRFALNLAFAPMMKALVSGNVTASIREKVFADVLALAQLAGIQRELAIKAGSAEATSQLIGFEHECNAHLALLYVDDPRYLPLPSSARGGSGTTYPNQTHDITVINQHWGKIRKVIPLEIKSKASLNDIKRYDALVVRGKMHLSITGKYSPEHTRNAYAAYYEGDGTKEDNLIVYQVTSTIKQLMKLYQQGGRQGTFDSPTSYHDLTALRKTHPEFSLNRPERY